MELVTTLRAAHKPCRSVQRMPQEVSYVSNDAGRTDEGCAALRLDASGSTTNSIVEFAIPGAPTESIDVKILEDSVHLLAPARDIEDVAALALGWPVKPDKAEATYENGLLRIEVPFKDPMEDAVKIAVKAGGLETKTKSIESPEPSQSR